MGNTAGTFVSAVVVAAGKGTRMNMDMNKQYYEIGGIPVLARTLKVLEECRSINEIVLVVNEADIVYCKEKIVEHYGLKKVGSITAGGKERQHSVNNGLLAADTRAEVILVHDGARPFITGEILEKNIAAALEFGASVTAVPVKDTIKKADENGYAAETPERSLLWAVQTPQTFKKDILLEAHQRAASDGFMGTDDSMLVERLGCKVKLILGSYDNIKITTREDLIIADMITGYAKGSI